MTMINPTKAAIDVLKDLEKFLDEHIAAEDVLTRYLAEMIQNVGDVTEYAKRLTERLQNLARKDVAVSSDTHSALHWALSTLSEAEAYLGEAYRGLTD